MSGHSKWATTHRQKEATDAKRGALFTKLAKTITVAARELGGDMDTNFKLRLAVEKAKAANMPKDNIERAVKKGTGEAGGGKMEELVFEIFGPAGSVLIVEAVSDNRNRTASNIKAILNKKGGTLGAPNSVTRMFDKKGIIGIKKTDLKIPLEKTELLLIDVGAEDIEATDGSLTIYTKPAELQKIKEAMENNNIPATHAAIEWIAKNNVSLSETDRNKLDKLIEALEEDEDVEGVYANIGG